MKNIAKIIFLAQQHNENAKFVVKIPFHTNPLEHLGDSFGIAKKIFFLLEKRFESYSNLKTDYTKFINEYIALNHMTRFNHFNRQNSFYLPHHCVFKDIR